MNTYSEAKKNTHFALSSSVLLSLRGTRKCDGGLPVSFRAHFKQWCSCALLRASASQHCVPRSNPRLRSYLGWGCCCFSLLASRIFCSTSPLSFPPQKNCVRISLLFLMWNRFVLWSRRQIQMETRSREICGTITGHLLTTNGPGWDQSIGRYKYLLYR